MAHLEHKIDESEAVRGHGTTWFGPWADVAYIEENRHRVSMSKRHLGRSRQGTMPGYSARRYGKEMMNSEVTAPAVMALVMGQREYVRQAPNHAQRQSAWS